jgi:hypothetical protein
VAACTVRHDTALSQAVEDRFSQDAAGRISAAQEEDTMLLRYGHEDSITLYLRH